MFFFSLRLWCLKNLDYQASHTQFEFTWIKARIYKLHLKSYILYMYICISKIKLQNRIYNTLILRKRIYKFGIKLRKSSNDIFFDKNTQMEWSQIFITIFITILLSKLYLSYQSIRILRESFTWRSKFFRQKINHVGVTILRKSFLNRKKNNVFA